MRERGRGSGGLVGGLERGCTTGRLYTGRSSSLLARRKTRGKDQGKEVKMPIGLYKGKVAPKEAEEGQKTRDIGVGEDIKRSKSYRSRDLKKKKNLR